MEIEVGNQKPDGLILDTEERAIYIIEGARCSDTAEAMEIVEMTKLHKYRALREELRRRYPGYQVKQLNFIIGLHMGRGCCFSALMMPLKTRTFQRMFLLRLQ